MTKERIYGLDIFRAIAILVVVRAHAGIFSNKVSEFLPKLPMIDGVDMFFVLSGYLIGTIIIRKINSSEGNFLTGKGILNFWKNRWFRTLPLYFVFLGIQYLIVYYKWVDLDITQFSHHFFTFTQNLFTGFYGFYWESWSLSIEEWFYFLFPVILLLISRIIRNNQINVLIVIALFLTIPVIYRNYLSQFQYDDFWNGVHVGKVVFTRLDSIGYGILTAYLFFYHSKWILKFKYPLLIFGLIILYIHTNYLNVVGYYKTTFYYSVIAIAFAMLLPFFISLKTYKNKIIGNVITWTSKISYSMYLINLPLSLYILKNHHPEELNTQFYFLIIYWVLIFLLGSISYLLIERTFLRLRDKL